MRVLAELGPAECGTCCLKVMQSGTDILICDGPYQMKFSRGQAHSLMAVLQVHFKDAFEFVDLGPVAAKDREPAEGTVALLCAAARKWAKWDARLQAGLSSDDPEFDVVASEKAHKWRTRTLSYGHHLLSAGVPEEAPKWSPSLIAQMEFDNKAPLEFNRISIGPAAEMKRLDTLVQQLCARVTNLEEAGG